MSTKLVKYDSLIKHSDRAVGSNSVISKYLNTVQFNIRLIPDVLGEWSTWMTLPEGERPSYPIFVPCVENSADRHKGICIVAIYPNGSVQYLAEPDKGYIEYLGFVSYKV